MNVSRKPLLFLIFPIYCIFSVFGQASEDYPTEIMQNYVKSVAQNSDLDITITLTREEYYDDGTVKDRDSLSFLSHSKSSPSLNNFNISTLSEQQIQSLVTDAEEKGVLMSLYQKYASEDGEDGMKETYFGTEELDIPESPAAEIVRDNNFMAGLKDEISSTIDQAEDVATVQFLQRHRDGTVKRNNTVTFYVSPMQVSAVEKMSNNMVESVAAEVKKAYKIDTDDRAPYIAHLLDKKFPKYYWQVLVNSTAYFMSKDVSMILKIGHDEYDIIGMKN